MGGMRCLGIDHGAKRIGIAVSDITGTLARPLTILKHISKKEDAARVLNLAAVHGAELIVVGQSNDEAGLPNLAGRRALRFAEQLKAEARVPVLLWDESLSSRDASLSRLQAGVPRKKRRRPLDAGAAAVMLQSFLDARGAQESGLPVR